MEVVARGNGGADAREWVWSVVSEGSADGGEGDGKVSAGRGVLRWVEGGGS